MLAEEDRGGPAIRRNCPVSRLAECARSEPVRQSIGRPVEHTLSGRSGCAPAARSKTCCRRSFQRRGGHTGRVVPNWRPRCDDDARALRKVRRRSRIGLPTTRRARAVRTGISLRRDRAKRRVDSASFGGVSWVRGCESVVYGISRRRARAKMEFPRGSIAGAA
jgi:hypothetical protein